MKLLIAGPQAQCSHNVIRVFNDIREELRNPVDTIITSYPSGRFLATVLEADVLPSDTENMYLADAALFIHNENSPSTDEMITLCKRRGIPVFQHITS